MPRIAGCALIGLLVAACGARTGTSDLLAAAGTGGSAGSGGSTSNGGSTSSGGSTSGGGGTNQAGSGGAAGSGGMTSALAIQSIAAGSRHTCILRQEGTVRCWGWGRRGALGYGNSNDIGDDETPAFGSRDVDFGGTAVQLVIGEGQTCVLLDTGAVRCWGAGTYGQLGYAHSFDLGNNESPSAAGDVDVGGQVVQLAAGHAHVCALLTTGAVRCWGYGADGRLGYGNTDNIGDDETPSAAGDVDVGGEVVSIAAGGTQTCAVLRGGAVRCWGAGSSGQLGYGHLEDIGDDETPRAAGDVDIGEPVRRIAAGGLHTCALLERGAVRCWGYAGSGRLGYGNPMHIGDDEPPRAAGDVDLGDVAIDLDTSNDHTCALLRGGRVRCWGPGSYGRLGYGDTERVGDDEPPRAAGDVDVGGVVRQIAVGGHHTCALDEDDRVLCWGLGTYGRLGYGNTDDVGDDETPGSIGAVPIF